MKEIQTISGEFDPFRRTFNITRLDLTLLSERDPKAAAALVPVLKESLLAEDNPSRIVTLAQALGNIAGPDAAAALGEGLRHKTPLVRYESAIALARSGEDFEAAMPALLEAVKLQPGKDRTSLRESSST